MDVALRENIDRVRRKIDLAAHRTGRGGEEIVLVSVTKGVPSNRVEEAIEAGLAIFGENRIQEAREKIERVRRPAAWHLVGHLQSNKANAAATLFQMIHSLDSAALKKDDQALCARSSRFRGVHRARKKAGNHAGPDDGQRTVLQENSTSDGHVLLSHLL